MTCQHGSNHRALPPGSSRHRPGYRPCPYICRAGRPVVARVTPAGDVYLGVFAPRSSMPAFASKPGKLPTRPAPAALTNATVPAHQQQGGRKLQQGVISMIWGTDDRREIDRRGGALQRCSAAKHACSILMDCTACHAPAPACPSALELPLPIQQALLSVDGGRCLGFIKLGLQRRADWASHRSHGRYVQGCQAAQAVAAAQRGRRRCPPPVSSPICYPATSCRPLHLQLLYAAVERRTCVHAWGPQRRLPLPLHCNWRADLLRHTAGGGRMDVYLVCQCTPSPLPHLFGPRCRYI